MSGKSVNYSLYHDENHGNHRNSCRSQKCDKTMVDCAEILPIVVKKIQGYATKIINKYKNINKYILENGSYNRIGNWA